MSARRKFGPYSEGDCQQAESRNCSRNSVPQAFHSKRPMIRNDVPA
jgi:hypothetical protein